ncbi:AAA family ATPase [Rhizobium leguminosarum bv. trifolii]|uniref:AAA family ATPase n=1 Tax=Rhizobium leguminosarum TaxID=384 RepID=UPI00140FE3B7|nr:AAA family ATPase [Rhizobium leguminosarum]QIO70615.1 AAA family ATPase [Rhizobium leguminosarum bv. trifolii]QIO77620.1 AAA family ATPase [Rhizobium leguminosarum bv. trifolii]
MKSGPDQDLLDEAIQHLLDATSNLRSAFSPGQGKFSRGSAPTALSASPRKFLAFCAFVKLMRHQRSFFTEPTSVLVINVPRAWPIDDFDYVADLCLKSRDGGISRLKTFLHPPRTRKGSWDFNPASYIDAQKLIVFLPRGAELHPAFAISADVVTNLELLDDRHVDSLARQMGAGPLSSNDKELLQQQDPSYIDSIFRKGRSASAALARLQGLSTQPDAARKLVPLSSYGEAGKWAMKLKSEIQSWREGQLDWADLDKGVLLYGPPGTGKTSFAASLANECGAHFVPTSLSKWQSHGHLGDLLKSMRIDFAEALENAPSILLIDEIDSVGDRRAFSGDNKHYCIEVVNALLQALDGVANRQGVVVVASTNFPEALDPALLRSGRLETHVQMKRPNLEERARILHFYLPGLGSPKDFREVARHLNGKTGADLEHLTRKAKQRARDANREPRVKDLWDAVPRQSGLAEDERWRVCVHEAAHAVMIELSGLGHVTCVEIFDDIHDNVEVHDALGRTYSDCPIPAIKTDDWYRWDIVIDLAGMAAEELVFGNRSTTAGGSRGSDVSSATQTAAEMVARFGLGKRLAIFPDEIDRPVHQVVEDVPQLRAEIDDILHKEYARAKTLLESERDTVIGLARALKDDRRLEGERLEALLKNLKIPTVQQNP